MSMKMHEYVSIFCFLLSGMNMLAYIKWHECVSIWFINDV